MRAERLYQDIACSGQINDCLVEAANFGRDADSIANLVGAIWGALCSARAVRCDWVKQAEQPTASFSRKWRAIRRLISTRWLYASSRRCATSSAQLENGSRRWKRWDWASNSGTGQGKDHSQLPGNLRHTLIGNKTDQLAQGTVDRLRI